MFAITYAAAFVTVIFAVTAAVLFMRRRTTLELLLAIYLFLVTIWIGANVAADVCYTPDCLYQTCTLALMAAMLKVIVQFVFTDLLIDGRFPSWRRFLLYAIPGIGLAVAALSPHAIVSMSFPIVRPAEIIPGVVYTFVFIYSLSNLLYCSVRLALALWKERDQTRRMQFWYVLTGLIIAGAGTLLFTVALPLAGEYRYYSLGPLCTLFFVFGCAYAISRHKLLDIRIAVRNGILYSVLVTLIVAFYLLLAGTFNVFITDTSHTSILFSAGITIVISAFGIPVIERVFRRMTDRIFFKETYDYAAALHTLTQILTKHVDFDGLVTESEASLAAILRADSVRIVLDPLPSRDSPFMQIPIEQNGTPIGSIHLGEKLSGDPYSSEDMQLLRTFAFQAGAALSRARLYQQVELHAHELEQKVEERTQELSRARERERQMMMDISHNLQTPLTILQTKLDSLKRNGPADVEVRTFEHALTSFSGFIYDLLSFAQIDSDADSQTAPETIDISELVFDVAEEIGTIASAQGIDVGIAIESGIVLTGNKKRLREALMNLASNSIKYMREDGIKQIGFSLRREDGWAVIEVSDSGLGIAVEDLPHIFDRFYRAKEPVKNMRGTGLGLAIVKRIVEQHDGTITAVSTVSEGTSMTIRLPLSVAS